jgi:ribonuclease-3
VDDQQWLQRALGCRLDDGALLTRALTHRSVGQANNERLEFLGDAVLGYIIGAELFRRFPEADEGRLSRLRVSLVKGSTLADVARELDLGAQLRLGSGERSGGGRHRRSILADTLEAVIGAIALDRGIEECRRCVLNIFATRLQALNLSSAEKDPKTRLQEFLQARRRPLPEYAVVDSSGEEHCRSFTVRCRVPDSADQAFGEGSSHRGAEQAAAASLLRGLESA